MPSLSMDTKHGVVRRRARHDGAAQAARKWRPLTDGIFKRAIPVAGNHCPFEDPLAVGAKRHADCSIGFALTEALRRAIMGCRPRDRYRAMATELGFAARLRPGNAGANTTVDHLDVLAAASASPGIRGTRRPRRRDQQVLAA